MTFWTPGDTKKDGYEQPANKSNRFHGCPYVSDEEIDKIIDETAERAAKKAVENLSSAFYQQVGKTVVNKFLIAIGSAAVMAYIWLEKHFIL